MTKRWFDALEKVFDAEINDRLPYQSKAKVYEEMATDGLVRFESIKWPGSYPVTVSGWFLTERGRLLYCEQCASSGGVTAMAKCKSCDADIVWGTTTAGKHIPLDAQPENRFICVAHPSFDEVRIVPTYQSHFSSCPHADQHRKKK